MRWELFAASSSAALAVSAAGLLQALSSEGNEEAFHSYVSEHVSSLRDELWVASHKAEVLAEGRRACEWLEIDPSPTSDVNPLIARYLIEARSNDSAPLSSMGRRAVVAGAWAYLCE